MNIELFITGMIIGLVTSAPIGPVNVLAIRRAVHYGFLPGLIAGFGAVLADGVFATAAAFGVTAISEFVERHEFYIQTIGGLLLIIFGIVVFRSHPHLKGGERWWSNDLARYDCFFRHDGDQSGCDPGLYRNFRLAGRACAREGGLCRCFGARAGRVDWCAFVVGLPVGAGVQAAKSHE